MRVYNLEIIDNPHLDKPVQPNPLLYKPPIIIAKVKDCFIATNGKRISISLLQFGKHVYNDQQTIEIMFKFKQFLTEICKKSPSQIHQALIKIFQLLHVFYSSFLFNWPIQASQCHRLEEYFNGVVLFRIGQAVRALLGGPGNSCK